MIRKQEEILEKFKSIDQFDDFFGVQRTDLLLFMEFETAVPFLKDEYVKDVKSGKEEYKHKTDPKKEILSYLPFAFEKAENQRGLSAARSLDHLKTWIWLDDDKFYNEIIEDIENYTNYGIPQLKKIATHYGFKREEK